MAMSMVCCVLCVWGKHRGATECVKHVLLFFFNNLEYTVGNAEETEEIKYGAATVPSMCRQAQQDGTMIHLFF